MYGVYYSLLEDCYTISPLEQAHYPILEEDAKLLQVFSTFEQATIHRDSLFN